MRVCIYGASSNVIDEQYMAQTEELAYRLGKRGCSLVFGAGANGNMGAAARGFHRAEAEIVGVVPTFFNVDGILYDHCTELIRTDTMRQRKQIMEDRSDAFIATPGGIGTYEEFFEMLTLKQLGRHNKPIAIFNINGYYNDMLAMLEKAISQNFMQDASRTLWFASDKCDEVIDYILNYSEKMQGVEQYKLF